MTGGTLRCKPSEIAWIDAIPSHWEVKPLLAVVQERSLSNVGMIENNLLSLSYGRIVRKDIAATDGLLPESFETYQIVEPGDVVLRLTDLQNDKRSLRSGLVTERGIITFAYTAISPTGVNQRYLSYLLRFYDLSKVFYSMGGGLRQSLKFSDLRRLPVVLPPLHEQIAIATFLDRETAKIDALVAEQELLIELLKEKRQAIISHAVTKGLNPDAPMKDSGVEWLGEVPAHWEVTPIRFAAKLESGHTPSRSRPDWWENCTIPWFSLADIWQVREAGRDYVYETRELISELGLANSSARLLPEGTVMLSRTASVGFSTIMGVPMATTQDFANWICGPRLDNRFLLWVSRGMRQEFARLMMGSTHNTIYMPDISAMRFALPPLEEQRVIVQHVERELARLGELSSVVEHSIGLLTERRAALISATVTGKIDVRSAADVETAAA